MAEREIPVKSGTNETDETLPEASCSGGESQSLDILRSSPETNLKQFDKTSASTDSITDAPTEAFENQFVSENNSLMMKPDRTPLQDKKTILIKKLVEVLEMEDETTTHKNTNTNSAADLRGPLLDRLRRFCKPDSYNILPSPESSGTEEEGRRDVGEMVGDTGTSLSNIEEHQAEGTGETGENSDLILSKLESETQTGSTGRLEEACTPTGSMVRLEGACTPTRSTGRLGGACTLCQMCTNIVTPIHLVAFRISDMRRSERCTALTKLWREIKITIKQGRAGKPVSQVHSNCNPCDLCANICATYHEYANSNENIKRRKIREDFADLIRRLDPSTQVLMISSSNYGKDYRDEPTKLCSSPAEMIRNPTELCNSTEPTLDFRTSTPMNLPDGLEADSPSESSFETLTSDVRHAVLDKGEVELVDKSDRLISEKQFSLDTSEFDSLTGESEFSDNLDTSVGVKNIPLFETASSRSSQTETNSMHMPGKMRNDLIETINKAINKEVKSFKKDLTTRLLGTLSPSISNSVNLSCHSPVFPVYPTKSQKPSKYDLLKNLPIAERASKERKHCLLANLNKPPPKKTASSGLQHVQQEIISSSHPTGGFPAISNSGLTHIKNKGPVVLSGRQHTVEVSSKPRQRDNTLTDMTYPVDEEVSEISDVPACLMRSVDLCSRRDTPPTQSSDQTVREETDTSRVSEFTGESGDSTSYCCECVHWEAHVSDPLETLLVTQDPSVMSGNANNGDEGCASDDSGAKSDYTSYTAIVTKTPVKSSLPKKIKLDLPRNLKRNSPTSFLLKGQMSRLSSPGSYTSGSRGSCTPNATNIVNARMNMGKGTNPSALKETFTPTFKAGRETTFAKNLSSIPKIERLSKKQPTKASTYGVAHFKSKVQAKPRIDKLNEDKFANASNEVIIRNKTSKTAIYKTKSKARSPRLEHSINEEISRKSSEKSKLSKSTAGNLTQNDDYRFKSITKHSGHMTIKPGKSVHPATQFANTPSVQNQTTKSGIPRTVISKKPPKCSSFTASPSLNSPRINPRKLLSSTKTSVLPKPTPRGGQFSSRSSHTTSEKSFTKKRSSSFDSGLASATTKSFRGTSLPVPVARNKEMRKVDLHTPNSLTRLTPGRNSPAITISFPKKKL